MMFADATAEEGLVEKMKVGKSARRQYVTISLVKDESEHLLCGWLTGL